jgi:Rrf2 family iron-sulfur cluster assembly transcriptional regulator
LKQEISLSYLEQLFAKLRRDGLVKGTRGPGGGYRLAQNAEAISVAAIITSVDEKADMTRCGGEANCQDGKKCLTHELWADLSLEIYKFLDGISLADLVNRPEVQEVAERQEITHQSHSSGLQSMVVEPGQLTGTTDRH